MNREDIINKLEKQIEMIRCNNCTHYPCSTIGRLDSHDYCNFQWKDKFIDLVDWIEELVKFKEEYMKRHELPTEEEVCIMEERWEQKEKEWNDLFEDGCDYCEDE